MDELIKTYLEQYRVYRITTPQNKPEMDRLKKLIEDRAGILARENKPVLITLLERAYYFEDIPTRPAPKYTSPWGCHEEAKPNGARGWGSQ